MSLVYNNVWIHECRTLAFETGPDYDPTNTDAMWQNTYVRVRGFVTASQGQFPIAGEAGVSSATTFKALMDKLSTPRRSLEYKIGSVTMITHPGGLDAKLGPIPDKPKIHEVNTGVFLVEFGVRCFQVRCDTDCEERDPVVSLRWTQTESFDENWYSRLTTQGRLIVRSDLLQSADSFRPQATPPILPDYRRVSSRYTLSPDGTQLEFQFEDQEVDRLPPLGATKASGKFTVTSPKPGIARFGQVDIHLEGPKGTSRKQLLIRAMAMGYSKLLSERFFTENQSLPIIWGAFKEDLFEPAVDVSMQGLLAPIVGGSYLAATSGIFAGTPGDNTPPPDIMRSVGQMPFGMAENRQGLAPPIRKRLAGLLAAAFRDPCACLVSETELRTDGASGGTGNPDIVGPPNQVPPADIGIAELSTLPSVVDLVADRAPYDTYSIETSYGHNSGRVLMPGTGLGANGGVGKVVDLTGEQMVMTVTWVAGRTARPPILPVYETGHPGFVPIRAAVTTQSILPSADGGAPMYLTAGFYQYAIVRPQTVELRAAVPPMMGPAAQPAALAAVGFWENIFQLGTQAANTNPFAPGGVAPGIQPPSDIAPPGTGLLDLPPGGGIWSFGGFVDLGGGGPPVNP